MRTILYIGGFKLSRMDAECQLVMGNAAILRELGYQVVLIGNEKHEHYTDLAGSKRNMNGWDVYDIQFSKSLTDLKNAWKTQKEIENLMKQYDVAGVICYGSPAFAISMYLLMQWCRRIHVPFVTNCVDIPCLSHGTAIQRVIKTTDYKLRFRACRKSDGLIAVSNCIADYCKSKKDRAVVVIPPLKDAGKYIQPEYNHTGTIKLVYGGNPFPTDGRKVDIAAYKDRLDLIIEYAAKMIDERFDVRLDIFSLTAEQYTTTVAKHKDLIATHRDRICFHGRVPREEFEQAFRDADFLMEFKVNDLMNRAAFPTKYVDAITSGTPALITKTGDIPMYMTEGVNGYYIDIEDREKGYAQMRTALQIKHERIAEMKKACFESKMFDYHNFIIPMKQFMDQLMKK